MKKHLYLLAVNFAVFSSLLVGLELFGQAFYYLKTGKFVFQDVGGNYHHKQLFEPHPFLAARLVKNAVVEKNGVRITSTTEHTRWTGSTEDSSRLVRVAVLGGSTTFGTNVTDADSWPALLQAKLGNRFSVANYGVPGYTTAEAITQMALQVPEIKPHFVVFYEGWNDIHNYHEQNLGADYYGHGIRQYDNLSMKDPSSNRSVLDRFSDVSALAKLMAGIKIPLLRPKPQPSLHEDPDPFVDRIYVRNLNTLKLLSENLSPYTFFVPQVLNYPLFTGKADSYEWTRHIKSDAMPALMDRFNQLMRTVCSITDPKCLYVDGVLKENWQPDDFVDTGHFTRKGGEKFTDILSRLILFKAKEAGMISQDGPTTRAAPGAG